MIQRRTYGLFNMGRRKRGSTAKLDRTMLRRVKDSMPDENAVVFWVEVNEGDDNNELDLIESMFPKWRLMCRSTREPIMVSPDLAEQVKRINVNWLEGTAVRRWSPKRSINSVVLNDGEVLRGYHPPAGPYTVGKRPLWARPLLKRSWDKVHTAAMVGNRRSHEAGLNVTDMFDANHYTYPLDGGGQQEIIHQRTDYGRAWAAEGFVADFRALSPVEMGIDSHDLQRMVGRYTPRGGE